MAPRKLLVADDSLTIQKVIRLALNNEGYEIRTVSDGNEALEQIAAFRPDAVLIDVSLPKKSAFEVKTQINQHRDLSHVKFILMSSAFKQVDEGQASSAGFDARLIKPFDPSHLRQVIQQALGSSAGKAAKRNEVGFQDFLNHLNNPPADEFGEDPKPLQIDEPLQKQSGAELGDDLWKTETLHTSNPPTTNNSDFLNQESSKNGDDDIRTLTEDTLKMSGLADDSGWNIQEPKIDSNPKKPDPLIEPPSAFFDFESAWGKDSPKNKNPEPAIQLVNPPTKNPETFPSFDFSEHEETAHKPQTQHAPASFNIDSADIERRIQEEVAKAMEKIFRQMLPDIAERVIKEEIHKLLQNPPL